MTLSLSWVQLMICEAAKFTLNALLPIVGPVGIDFKEDMRGQRAGEYVEPRGFAMAI